MTYQYNPKWKTNMSDAMISVVEDLNQGIEQELALCDQKIDEVKTVWLAKEPSKTSDGKPVTHGASIAIKNVMLYWENRRKLLLDLIGVSEHDYLKRKEQLE